MPEFHSEPFLCLAGLTHKSALISWGAFFFKVEKNEGSFKLVDDGALNQVFPPRRQTIGESSEPYAANGLATVEVFDASKKTLISSISTSTANHCWVAGLQPDTEYTYRVIVNGEEWAAGERRDWVADKDHQGLKRASTLPMFLNIILLRRIPTPTTFVRSWSYFMELIRDTISPENAIVRSAFTNGHFRHCLKSWET